MQGSESAHSRGRLPPNLAFVVHLSYGAGCVFCRQSFTECLTSVLTSVVTTPGPSALAEKNRRGCPRSPPQVVVNGGRGSRRTNPGRPQGAWRGPRQGAPVCGGERERVRMCTESVPAPPHRLTRTGAQTRSGPCAREPGLLSLHRPLRGSWLRCRRVSGDGRTACPPASFPALCSFPPTPPTTHTHPLVLWEHESPTFVGFMPCC